MRSRFGNAVTVGVRGFSETDGKYFVFFACQVLTAMIE